MKPMFILFAMLALPISLLANNPPAMKVKAVIGFEDQSTRLSPDAINELEAFKAYAADYLIEKVDIVALCAPGEVTYHTLRLSRERSMEVYNYLTSFMPDEGDYELRYFDPLTPDVTGVEQSDCVIITAYLLRKDAPKLADPPRQLFPEEFPNQELPVSLTAARKTATSPSKAPQAQKTGQKFTMENIYFEGNSALYTGESEPTLNEVLAYLLANPDYQVHLIGHVNGSMGKRYLKKAAKTNPERQRYKNAVHLSLARAESIRDYLVFNGVDDSRITCEGRGGKDKVYHKPTSEKQHRANRRIEIVLAR